MPIDDQKKDRLSTDQPDESALLARRRLLKLGAYIPPAIVGMAIIGSMSKTAHASRGHGGTVGSCMPSACQPCIDSDDDDSYNGKHPHDDDVRACKIEKTKKKHRDKRKKHKKNKNHS